MYDRNNPTLRAEVDAMMACPEFALVKDELNLKCDTYDQHGRLSQALGRLDCAERITERRDIYGFLRWTARLPSGLVVQASAADRHTSIGRD